jgi:peroxiredoxin
MSAQPPPDPASPPAPAPLEGEGPSQVGIMDSEHTWIVPPWVKAVTFWVTVLALGTLAWQQVDKRRTFRGLLVDSVVEPENWGNSPAPEILLPASYHDGKEGGGDIKLSDHRGKWVFINFWATWCPPCRDEMPSMEMLNRRFKDQGLVMIAVSVDDSEAELARFFGDEKPSFTVLWDREKAAANSYSSRKFPESYLISPDGRIAAKYVGPRDWYNQATVQYFEDVLAGRRKPVG